MAGAFLLAAATAVVLTGYACAYALARALLPHKDACVWELADSLFYVPYVPVMLYLVALSLYELAPGGVDARWHRSTVETRMFLALYVVQSVLHVGVLFLKRKVASPALYMVHHTLSISCYGFAFHTGRMHFWAVLDALCEVTNVFLNNLFLFRQLGIQDKLPATYKANGALLWVSYVVFRMALFPAWLWLFYRDVALHPRTTWDAITVFERYAYVGTTAALLLISTLWFGKITRGLMAALGLLKPEAEEAPSAPAAKLKQAPSPADAPASRTRAKVA